MSRSIRKRHLDPERQAARTPYLDLRPIPGVCCRSLRYRAPLRRSRPDFRGGRAMIQLFNWFRRRGLERGLDRELQYHFDRRVADLTGAGVPESEARRRVARELGLAQVREEVRDVWLTRWLRDLLYDLRYSARSLLRTPSFTATTLLSLALGIGATTAIYSLVDQVILHALPVREPERLVLVDWKGDHVVGGFGSFNLMSYPLCRDLEKQSQFFDGVLCRSD